MNVLVTGANGLLGHHVVMELIKRKHFVNIIVRSTKDIFFDLSLVNVFVGNFTEYSVLYHAAQNCNAIIHIAAVTSTHLLHYKDYENINVYGSAMILNVANELNIDRIIYISTANTIGYGTDTQLADESYPIQFPFTESYYAQSKLASEQLFSQASKQAKKNIVIIHPSFIIGAYDTKPSSGKLVLMAYKRWFNFVPKGGKNFVAATDVASIVCNALTMGINGEHYLATGINMTFKSYYKIQKQEAKYFQIIIEVPTLLLRIIGFVGDLFRFVGVRTEICSMNLNQLIINEFYSNLKAKKELGLEPTELKFAIRDAINWFKENNKM